jgi:kumamolisin
MARATRRTSVRRRVRAVGLALALLAAALLPVASAAPAASRAPADADLPPSASGSAGFAQDAGYSASDLTLLADPHPPSGLLRVDVVFHGPTASAPGAGLTAGQYAERVAWFRTEGLTITHTWPDRLAISLSGTPAQLDRVFATTLVAGTYAGRPVVLPASPPALPPSIEASVAGVVGLSSGLDLFSLPLEAVPAAAPGASGPSSANEVTPAIARQIYDASNLYNATGHAQYANGTRIALLLWGEGYSPPDLEEFYSAYYPTSTFPAVTIDPYPVDGAPSPSTSALSSGDLTAVEELTLDLEWSGSMAPGATLDAVYAPDGSGPSYNPSSADMTDALLKAISLNVSVISMSFGVAEQGDGSLASAWNSVLATAASDGITVLAATGDTGGDVNADCTGGPAPSYPATDPNVIAVGGTAVDFGGVGTFTGSFSESAWSKGGGGFSTQFSAPSWQEVGNDTAPIEANGGRGTPDVSATAANDFLYFDYGATAAAGTSFATPLWAGLFAEMDAKFGANFGFVTPRLYNVGAAESSGAIEPGLADITSGSNCVASAASSDWDAATGWGSPRAVVLYYDLEGSFINLTLDVSPSTVGPGGSVTIDAEVANHTTGAPINSTPVQFSLAADTPYGPCVGTFGAATASTNSTGWVEVRLTVPYCYLGSNAIVSATVATARLYGTASSRVAVNLLGLIPGLAILARAPWSYLGYSLILGVAIVAGGLLGRRPPSRVAPAPPSPLLLPGPAVPPPGTPGPGPPASGGPPPASPPPGPPAGSTAARGSSPPATP